MTKENDENGSYSLPTSWEDVTVSKFCALAQQPDRTMADAAALFAGRVVEVTARGAESLAFLNTPPSSEGGLPYPQDLGQETYLQVELIREAVAQGGIGQWLPRVYALFTARLALSEGETLNQEHVSNEASECLTWPLPLVFPAVMHCWAEFERLNTQYAALREPCVCRVCATGQVVGASLGRPLSFRDTMAALARRLSVPVATISQMPYQHVADLLLAASWEHDGQARIHQN